MVNFKYYTPTEIIFGRGVENEVGHLLESRNAGKVLVHYGGTSAKKSGLLDLVYKKLNEAGIAHLSLGGVQPNPRLALVQEGIKLCKAENVDYILAVGGGSVVDSAKAIALGATADCDVWDILSRAKEAKSSLPVGVILTMVGAGSEMSDATVITNEKTKEKRSVHSRYAVCDFALMNPELTLTVNHYQTAVGCADILMHTMERYFTKEKTMQITDGIAESLLRTVMNNARILTRKPDDYDARAEIMWASSLSHNGLTSCGGGRGDWACHAMGHALSAYYDLAHGASLTALWGSWAGYVYKANPARFARFAYKVLGIEPGKDAEETALNGIEEMVSLFWALELPTSISEAGIELDEADVERLATECTHNGTRTVGNFHELSKEDIMEIYKLAL